MLMQSKVIDTFPSLKIAAKIGSLPIEVSLIAQLGHGAGNHLFEAVLARQQAHHDFLDELDEPSAKLASTDFSQGDATALYSFAVGAQGHPFHRHAGHRVFTAISGSAGAQLRFSTASDAELAENPLNFIRHLQYVNIPPDSLFTVRFGGETWHQFASIDPKSTHPVFFALSCHTNELGGNLSEDLRAEVMANQASIPSLTELLPAEVLAMLAQTPLASQAIPTRILSLTVRAGSVQSMLCKQVRSGAGLARGFWGRWRKNRGYVAYAVLAHPCSPADSLLQTQMPNVYHHDDFFSMVMPIPAHTNRDAAMWLALLLEGFVDHPPKSVACLMHVRNIMVKPMGLRTASLGCPVSSLLSEQKDNLFADKFPVLAQQVDSNGRMAQVILGANDKHLMFRSCVGVRLLSNTQIEFSLGTRVQFHNAFGRFYMAMIERVHRRYVTPTMLKMAVAHVLKN